MLTVKTIPVTPYQQNARILINELTNDAVIIDPGGDIPQILAELPANASLKSIWITHSHIDHVSGVLELLNHFKSNTIDVIAHSKDGFNRDNLAIQSQMMNFPYSGDFSVTQFCEDGDLLSVGSFSFQVLYTPGHAVGHISLFSDRLENSFAAPILIAGDALFKGSIGRTDLPGGNHQELLDSISNKIFTLPTNTVVCSGHGPNTTVGIEKKTNPFFT